MFVYGHDVLSESDTAICASCRIINNNIMVTYEGKYYISDGGGMLITFNFVIAKVSSFVTNNSSATVCRSILAS